MPYANETDRYNIPWWETGEISSGDSNEDAALNAEWPLELINKVVAGDACDCTLGAGFQVAIGAGLSIDVAAGSGQIGGLTIYAAAPTNKPSLPDDTATIYVYLKLTATTKRDRSFTVEISLSGPPLADAIYIATCTTAGGAVTAVNNSPASRTPRLPGSISGIPGLRVVAPAGAQYTSPKTAIAAAVAGDLIFICAGSYDITSTLTIPANGITILGADRASVVLNFTAADATHCISLAARTDVDMRDFTIQAVAGKTGRGIDGGAAHYWRIENVYIAGPDLSYGIYLNGATRPRIRTTRIAAGTAAGLYLNNCSDGLVSHNLIEIATGGATVHAIMVNGLCHRCLFIGNNIICSGASTRFAVTVFDSDDLQLADNLIRITSPAANTVVLRVCPITRSCVRNVIANNQVHSASVTGVAIYLATADPYNLDDTRVSDNGAFAAATGVHILDARCRYTFAHDNMIRTSTTGITDAGTGSHLADNA